jgi:transposase
MTQEVTSMKFYTKQHDYYCGIDLHARCLYLCILNQDGEIVLHKNIKASAQALLKAIQPFRSNLVIGVECMFTWYWVADLCADEEIEFVLGHALYMKAIHGGKAKNDKIDSHKIATLMRGGMFPLAYVYPRHMRATRDLMRRRMHLMRKRSELMAHIHNTNSQYNHPIIRKDLRYAHNRAGLTSRFSDASTRKSIELDMSLIDFYDEELNKVEWFIQKQANQVDKQSLTILRSIHGIGMILSLVILYEIGDINRFPRVQDFVSYSRLVKCKKESAGKVYGSSGKKIGNAFLKWAFSEAAVLFLKGNPEAKAWVEKKANQHNKAKALTILAHKLGRAVYIMLKQKTVFDQQRLLGSH